MRRKLFPSRSAARAAIEQGLVTVGSVPDPKPSTLVAPDDPIGLTGEPDRFVGRGGHKLDHALHEFGLDIAGRWAIDVGASTGGFTDCLLQRGAASVVAVDVGYGQLDHRLRTDPRVTVVERTNVRHADPAALGAPFDIVVADLSFISLHLVAEQLAALGGDATDWVLLVKPQFEVGKDLVGKGGVVRDPAIQVRAIELACDGLSTAGIGAVGLIESPLRGASGNREFLLHARRGDSSLHPVTVRGVVYGEDEP